MQKIKSKSMAILIAALLTISMGASLLIQNASAHGPGQGGTPWQIPTFAYLVAAPNPIGINQTTIIYMWLGNSPYDASTLYNDYRYRNYDLSITGPDGKTQKINFPYISDPTNSQYYKFTPTEVGAYQLNFTYEGQNINDYDHANDAYVNDSYLPSSTSITLTSQATPLPAATASFPLPTAYWTRPIDGQNTYWYTISSNWLGSGSPVESATGYGTITGFSQTAAVQEYPGDAVGPLTSHVMWTYPIEMGGTVGGNNFQLQGAGYTDGDAYSQRFSNPIIIDGYLYYTLPVSFTGSTAGATVCQDLTTGQIIWESTAIPALSFGYIYNLYDSNQHGVYPPILFTSGFARAFDAYTGDPLFNTTGIPTGTTVAGPNGEQLKYVLSNAATTGNSWYLSEWNSSRLWDFTYNPWTGGVINSPTLFNESTSTGANLNATQASYASVTEPAIGVPAGTNNNAPATYNYTVYGNVVNASSPLYSYDWNVSIPWRNTMTTAPTVVAAFYDNIMLCRYGTLPAAGAYNPYNYFAIDLNTSDSTFGQVLWNQTYSPPAGNLSLQQGPIDPVSKVFVLASTQTMQWFGFSLTTGAQIWGPTAPQNAWDYYGDPGTSDVGGQAAYGNLYSSSFGGILYCYDLKTGTLLWTFGNGGPGNTTYSGFNTNYGDYPTFIANVGNGIIYLVTAEHTITNPIYKGALARAVNATTGHELWELPCYTYDSGTNTESAIADGFQTVFNAYDDSIYSIGQGPSATTISAPNIAIPFGTPIVITGTVLDVSAGTKQNQQAADFPYGVPVSSDASMKDWMGYVYEQEPIPTNFTGVPVTLYVLDSNNNTRPIGTTTTTESGTYSYTWTPDIPGSYTIMASFAGTNGYWPSSAQTAFDVTQSTTTQTPTQVVANSTPTETYFVVSTIAIIIAIAIVGALVMLTLRKRP